MQVTLVIASNLITRKKSEIHSLYDCKELSPLASRQTVDHKTVAEKTGNLQFTASQFSDMLVIEQSLSNDAIFKGEIRSKI